MWQTVIVSLWLLVSNSLGKRSCQYDDDCQAVMELCDGGTCETNIELVLALAVTLLVIVLICICTIACFVNCCKCCMCLWKKRSSTISPVQPINSQLVLVPLNRLDQQPSHSWSHINNSQLPPPYDVSAYTYIQKE